MGPTPFGGWGRGGGVSPNCENLPQNVVMVFARKRLGVKKMFALVLGNF